MGKGGDNAGQGPAASDVLQDPVCAPFLGTDFDALKFASAALVQGGDSSTHLREIRAGIDRLETEIRAHLSAHEDELIGSLGSLGPLEVGLDKTALSIAYLRSLTTRVRSETVGCASRVRELTTLASNLRATIDLLQHVAYRLKLISQLRTSVGSESIGLLEAASAARILCQIQSLDETSGIDISGVAALREHEGLLRSARQSVTQRAEAALREGMTGHSQAELGSGLQVFFNLGTLPAAVDQAVAGAAARADAAFAEALDPRRRPAGGAGSGEPAARPSALWEDLASALAALRAGALAAWHLEQVLLVKRDAATGRAFFAAVLEGRAAADARPTGPVVAFWAAALPAVARRFEAAFRAAAGGAPQRATREALEASYPRLAAALEETVAALRRDAQLRGGADAPAAEAPSAPREPFAGLVAVAHPFQQAAGDGARGLLGAGGAGGPNTQPFGAAGLAASVPSPADAQRLVARLHEELKSGASGGRTLAADVAALAARTLRGAAAAVRGAAASGPELRAVSGVAPAALQRNVALCNALAEVPRCLAASLPWLDGCGAGAARARLEATLRDEVGGAQLDLIMPTLRALSEWLEEPLQRLSSQPSGVWAGSETEVAETATSLAAGGAAGERAPSVARALVLRLAARLLAVYVRHASLARPLDGRAAMQIAKDIGDLEAAVAGALVPLEAVPEPARELRAFRKALFIEPALLAEAALGEAADPGLAALPAPVAVHVLVGRGPEAVPSPHARLGLTAPQYSLWLDQHSDAEAIKFIAGAALPAAKRARDAEGGDDPALLALLQALQV
ncbi:hypothetical protein QBZ16_003148 [Prototheca wickerhamii]|uniref:Conserved oligomeric Golgi complex subunit 5 n=1 Tax=Prototheca wickerhamii TaxID=3111 RepID=A0AAD9MNS4_PROWI|nr:hypothetical protein QBZ16_003148 [Prototheca wickerhamii]